MIDNIEVYAKKLEEQIHREREAHQKEIVKLKVQAERWKIAYEMLEEQVQQDDVTDVMRDLQEVIAKLLQDRYKRIDENTRGN